MPVEPAPAFANLPINQRVVAVNAWAVRQYDAAEAARERYWRAHPTLVACIKCMDGRVHFPVMTDTPVGVVKPFRAIGGAFEVWWPTFMKRFERWVEAGIRRSSHNLLFVTYHFSASDPHLGCAGWKYETAAAKAHAGKLAADLSEIYGEQLVAVVTGVETDQDELILHGVEGDVRGSELIGLPEERVHAAIRGSFPRMPDEIIHDLVPFMVGNAQHVAALRMKPRSVAGLGHDERIIALGVGFDWLALSNLALIINDADPCLDDAVATAASIIEKNLARAQSGDDAVLFTNVQYEKPGRNYRAAVKRARGLSAFARKVIQQRYPELAGSGRLHTLIGVTFEPSKELEVIESSQALQ
jgi:hypothetical protein